MEIRIKWRKQVICSTKNLNRVSKHQYLCPNRFRAKYWVVVNGDKKIKLVRY